MMTFLVEDELQNVEMAEEERRKRNVELKTKKRDYKGYDDDEFVAGNEGMKRAVLAKYDEDIEGVRETVSCYFFHFSQSTDQKPQDFRLGSSRAVKKDSRAQKEQAAASVNKS